MFRFKFYVSKLGVCQFDPIIKGHKYVLKFVLNILKFLIQSSVIVFNFFCFVLLVLRKTLIAILLEIKIVDKRNLQGTMADPHICIALVIDIVISLYF